MEAIGAVLRHASIETTYVYTKVDVDLLDQVVMPCGDQGFETFQCARDKCIHRDKHEVGFQMF